MADNVVTLRPKQPPVGKLDLGGNLEVLFTYANKAREAVSRSRSQATCLRHYTEWLRRYYELDGAVKSAFHHMEKEVRVHGSEADTDRLDEIIERMAHVDDLVKGPHPWLSLPSAFR